MTEVIPNFMLALLAAWLGANVVIRGWRERGTRVFGLLTALVAMWAMLRVVRQLTSEEAVRVAVGTAEAGVAPLLTAALLHVVFAFVGEHRWNRVQQAALAMAYGGGLVSSYLAVTGTGNAVSIGPPDRDWLGISANAVRWGGTILRGIVLLGALWWVSRARRVGGAGVRHRQLSLLLAAVAGAALGAMLLIYPTPFQGAPWIGTAVMVVGLALCAYAVLVRRVFLSPSVARRSFYYSLINGLITTLFLAVVLSIEGVSRSVLGIGPPLVTALALVLTIACFDPVRLRFRTWMDRRLGSGDIAYSRLMRAMGSQAVASTRPEEAVQIALEQLCRALGIRSAIAVRSNGDVLARWGNEREPVLELPLHAGESTCGTMFIGPKKSRLPYTPVEKELLGHAAAYIASSLQLHDQQTEQALALENLRTQREALQQQEEELAGALIRRRAQGTSGLLQVFALGTLRVEREGEMVERWGGPKAGTRQAEAMFAFLFDRGERGVAKDEFLEVIWPDIGLDRADPAFHRTIGGLRRTLDSAIGVAGAANAVTYHNDRYRLRPDTIGYSDVAAFEERLTTASASTDSTEAIAMLEEARHLYRGEYLDDCPFYGDSLFVEERRALLRGRYIDVLLALGARYEHLGDPSSAAAAYRQALKAADDDCPRADDGLARLGLPL